MAAIAQSTDTVTIVSACFECGQVNDGDKILKECAQCHFSVYCSKECQTKSWPQHKIVCKKVDGEETKLRKELRTEITTLISKGCQPDITTLYVTIRLDGDKNNELLSHEFSFKEDLTEDRLKYVPEQYRHFKKELMMLSEKHPNKEIVQVLRQTKGSLTPVANFVFAVQKKSD